MDGRAAVSDKFSFSDSLSGDRLTMAPEVQLDDDFRALGLEPGAGAPEVRKAYRRLVKQWHPDRHHLENYEAKASAEKKFREIDEAYRRIARTWGKAKRPASPAGRAFSTARRAGAKTAPASQHRFRVELFSAPRRLRVGLFSALHRFRAGLFSAGWPTRPANLSLAAGLIILILFFVLISNIAPDRPIHVHRRLRHNPPTTSTNKEVRPKSAPSRRASHPAHPKPGAGSAANFFTLGSSYTEVLDIQGKPTRIQGDTWVYGLSAVSFKNGTVCGYNNFDGALRVKIEPGPRTAGSSDHITIGSTRQQVLLVQGTPTRIEGNHWFYGFAELIFQDGLLTGYDNYFGTLKVRLLPSAPPDHGTSFFKQGSTPDEVLAVQGTPTAVHGNRWSYNFDYVFFRDGKVSGVLDSDGELRFAGPETPGAAKGP